MSKGCLITAAIVGVLVLIGLAGFFMYRNAFNTIVRLDEDVNSKTGNLNAQYQRRLDLIPNLVEVVKNYASHERETLEAVVNARASATQTKLDVKNAESLAQFQNAQGALTQALSRLMVVVEQYPNLKADQNFRDLQVQLEGTENRIKQARYDYNESVKAFNTYIREFFVSIFFGSRYQARPYFEAEQGADKAPKVKF